MALHIANTCIERSYCICNQAISNVSIGIDGKQTIIEETHCNIETLMFIPLALHISNTCIPTNKYNIATNID